MILSLENLTKLFSEKVTVIEPHHDDFVLDVFGSMYYLASIGYLKKLKIITVFGISPGCSVAPTSILGKFFNDFCEFESIEYLYPNVMEGGNAKFRREYANKVKSLEEQFELRSGRSFEDFKKDVVEKYEGTVLAPVGFKHPDHNLLARLPSHYVYREYPYWWHREESYPKEGLYKYFNLDSVGEFDLEWIADLKFKVFRTVYKDVQGQFNPLFGSARPPYYTIRTEEFFVKI